MRHAFVFGLLFLPVLCPAQTTPVYQIGTVAGSGPDNSPNGGFYGDGGPAIRAMINLPTSVALDSAGNLFFCDWNATVRRVDARTGVITTVAGTGVRGFSGDGGPAVGAELGGPGSIALDGTGDIYFSDVYNYRIRRIATTGTITTIAGNGGQFASPDGTRAAGNAIGYASGITFDSGGNLYFANGGDSVKKIAAGTGILTTVAGAGASVSSGDGGPAIRAQLDQPSTVRLDSQGNIYIAARGENRIRKVDAATGIITTIAGSGAATLTGIAGFTVYPSGFAGDGGPATRALLNDPECIALDKAGNLYISDVMNFRVRRVDARTGIIETIAGTGVRGFSTDTGPALGAELTTPSGLVVDNAGRIYFGDLFNQRIRVLTPTANPHSRLPEVRR